MIIMVQIFLKALKEIIVMQVGKPWKFKKINYFKISGKLIISGSSRIPR
jgi:hypothetical protein